MFRLSNNMGFGVIPKVTDLSIFASATSTAATITAPANIIAGDLLVLFDSAVTGGVSPPATVVPTGFTSISNVSLSGFPAVRSICSYKIAVGTEGGTSITGMDGTDDDKMMYAVRANVPITAVTVVDVEGDAGAGNPAAQTITSGTGLVPLIVFGAYSSENDVDPRTFTVGGSAAKDGEINSSTFAYLAYKIYNSTPSDVVVDIEDEGNFNTLQSFYLQAA